MSERNIETVSSSDALSGGASLGDAIVASIRACSFVVIVMTEETLPPAVLFEVGVASAFGLPLAVLDTRQGKSETTHIDVMPSDTDFALSALLRAPTLHADLVDERAIESEFHDYLKGVLDSLRTHEPDSGIRTQSVSLPLGSEGQSAEARCAEALERSDARVVLHPGGWRGTPDMVASLPQLGPAFDPILVEVAGLRARLRQKRATLGKAMIIAGAHLGLLVTLDDVPMSTDSVGPMTTIVTVSLKQLEKSNRHELYEWFNAARNRLVHGG